LGWYLQLPKQLHLDLKGMMRNMLTPKMVAQKKMESTVHAGSAITVANSVTAVQQDLGTTLRVLLGKASLMHEKKQNRRLPGCRTARNMIAHGSVGILFSCKSNNHHLQAFLQLQNSILYSFQTCMC
jgi:hypothetical protein